MPKITSCPEPSPGTAPPPNPGNVSETPVPAPSRVSASRPVTQDPGDPKAQQGPKAETRGGD